MPASPAYRLPLAGLLALSLTPMLALASGPAPAPTTAASAATSAPAAAPFVERALRVEGALLAAQPAEGDFATLRGAGVTRVISLRTPEERATLGFDDQAAAKAAGLRFDTLPIAGNGGFTPAVLDAFAKAMADGGGDVLLHCGSSARAGQLYAAWLVRDQGLSPQEAMQRVAPLGLWPTPMERMLGRPMELRFAAPAPASP